MSKTLYPIHPVMLVDDEEAWLRSFGLVLRSNGITNIVSLQDSRKVMDMLEDREVSALVLDLTMPHLSGEELLPQIKETYPHIPVIIITGLDLVDKAVQCMKYGAFDYYTKVTEEERLLSGVRKAIDIGLLRTENKSLKEHFLEDKLEHPEVFEHIITHNKKMRSIFQYCEAIAQTGEPVLITGETGSGKELIARALHELSARKGSFVPVNVAGLDETMFTDTLFGHKKGAYTGADQSREGLVEKAAGGSLFLDEIGDLSPASQVKLLRLLQEREYLPLGSDIPKRTDCRMIFATHRSIESLQQAADFRKDLFYRLRAHHIELPPLRQRLDDLPLLVDHFMRETAKKMNKKPPAFPKELISLLKTYNFPGNIRELQHLILEALSKHTSRTLSMDSFKEYIYQRNPQQETDLESIKTQGRTPFSDLENLPSMKEVGYYLALEALQRADGNQTIAAEMLGITRQALNWRLKQVDK